MGGGAAKLTYIGGPTALIEFGGVRLLTDPTFDPAGSDYPTAAYTLHKTQDPALSLADLLPVDAVLLSHDHHFDNLDRAGREALASCGTILTTGAAAARLGGGAVALEPWERLDLAVPGRGEIQITGTPARHGPPGGDRGPVIGFALTLPGSERRCLYLSGDTVWFEGVAEVGRRFEVAAAVLNLGAAKVAPAGPLPLTFTAAEALELARAWPRTAIVPLHFEGWEHFSEGAAEVRAAFAVSGLTERLLWPTPGQPLTLGVSPG